MNLLLLGNVFSFVGAIFLGISTFKKNKKDMVGLQILNCIPCIISCILLGGITGAITNTVALTRNVLIYKEKMNLFITMLLVSFLVIFGVVINQEGIIGLCPIIASSGYCLALCSKKLNFQIVKIILLFHLLLWLAYDLYIKSFPSAIMDTILIATTFISFFQKNPEQENIQENIVEKKMLT